VCSHLLDVVIPQIVCQLFSCGRTVLVFVFVLSCGLYISNGYPGSREASGRWRGGTYGCLGDVFRNINVNHSVALADDPSNIFLLSIGLEKVSAYSWKSLSTNAGYTYHPTVVGFKLAGHGVRISHELRTGDGVSFYLVLKNDSDPKQTHGSWKMTISGTRS
jgi:hypothetical protein